MYADSQEAFIVQLPVGDGPWQSGPIRGDYASKRLPKSCQIAEEFRIADVNAGCIVQRGLALCNEGGNRKGHGDAVILKGTDVGSV